MKSLIKSLNWIGWLSGVIGLLFVLLGLIQAFVTGRFNPETELVNYFHAANSFFLFGITLSVYLFRCERKQE